VVSRRPLPGVQLGQRRNDKHLDAADQRRRSGRGDEGAGAELAAELVSGWEVHCVPVGGGRRGIFIIPALGGAGQERRIAAFGYNPRWSLDSSQVLFQSGPLGWSGVGTFSVVAVDGGAPRKALVKFFEVHGENGETSATWHPDGRRVTVWADNSLRPGPSPNFWTVPLDGGKAVHTDIPPDIEKKFEELTIQGGYEWVVDAKFTWAPAGDALFLERTFRGARSLWRLAIDPKSLAATGLERLTTGGSLDTAPANLAGWKEAGIHCGERKDQRMDVRAGHQRRENCGERAPGHLLWTERMADGDHAGREQAGVFGYSLRGATVMGEVSSGWT